MVAAVLWASLAGAVEAVRAAESGRGGLLAADSGELPGLQALQVGSSPGVADAVARGLALPGWLPESPAVISATETRTRLWASLLAPGPDGHGVPLPESSVLTSSDDPSVAVASVLRSPDDPLALEVHYECRRAGATRLQVAFVGAAGAARSRAPAAVQLSLEKECAAQAQQGLSVGTSPGMHDVVLDGSSAWSTATAIQRVIPAAKDHLRLYPALRPGDAGAGSAAAAQLAALPRITVTTLASGGAPEGTSELQRWQRRLSHRAHHEERLREEGLWGPPLREARHGDAAAPEVLRVEALPQDGALLRGAASLAAPLDLRFECRAMGAALVEVELRPQLLYQPHRPAVVAFVKQCAAVTATFFDLSTHQLRPTSLQGGAPQPADLLRAGAPVGHLPSVGGQRGEEEVFWRSARPELGAPSAARVECDGGIASATVGRIGEDQPRNGILTGSLRMHFGCLKAGSARCVLRVAWPRSEGPSVSFRKVCGGLNRGVDVESDVPGAALVLVKGQDQASWTLGGAGVPSQEVVFEPSQQNATFTVFRHKKRVRGDDAVELGPALVNVSNSSIVEARLIGDLARGGEVDSAVEGEDLQVEMQCVGTGTSQIKITLPDASGELLQPISFAFTKKCGTQYGEHNKWLLFGGVMWISVCILLMACIAENERMKATSAREARLAREAATGLPPRTARELDAVTAVDCEC